MTRAASGTPPGQAGLTLVEVMVSVLLVGIAAAFVFSIQVRTSQALRDQSTVAEAQQVLRAASDLIVSDLRQAGYKAKSISLNGTSGVAVSGSLAIHNSSSGPDSVKLQYADTSFTAHIMDTAARNPGEIEVDDNTGFRDGDTILAVYLKTLDAAYGTGCLMTATGRTGTTKVTTASSGLFNTATNDQCDALDAHWNERPYMLLTRGWVKRYRIKPDDPRGILQVSLSAGARTDDWQDIAVGIVDLQIALRVYQPNDDANDEDADGDTKRDWFSGSDMGTILGADPDNQALEMSLTIVAKTSKNVAAVTVDKTPDIYEGTDKDHNKLGDREGTTLPVTDTASMYYGDVVFRSFTQRIDLRNQGIGF